MSDFLLELRSEEIPARMQAGARAELEKLFRGELEAAGVTPGELTVWSTPRRLALIARDLPDATEAVSEEAKGPPVGAPDQAVDGFCRKNGVTREQLEVREVKGRETYFAVIDTPGRAMADVLAEAIPAIIRDFSWPKSMRWGAASVSTESMRWVRPLSGIVTLLGNDVVPCEVHGVTSGAVTLGHRFHHSGDITIGNADDYAMKLRAAHVIVDHEERADLIRTGAAQVATEAGLKLVEDEGLVVENAGLTEWPIPLLGRFEEDFLEVPPETIQLTARVNQKYFVCTSSPNGGGGPRSGGGASPATDSAPLHHPADGPPPRAGEEVKLANAFICTANIEGSDGGAAIVDGNRKVLAARLSDARFFWDVDRKKTLAEHAKGLERITFHEKLGTVADKRMRLANVARELCEDGIVPNADADYAEFAALVCKADLVTEMVGEFPELQGSMGGYYARAEGLPNEVADAIRDHYKPVGQSDRVPSAPESVAVSLADKLDNLAAFFGIEERPTGSKDPFALRRAAIGVSRLILENRLRFSLFEIIRELPILSTATDSFAIFERIYGEGFEERLSGEQAVDKDNQHLTAVTNEVVQFIIDRLKVQQREAGVRHDLIDAVFALGGEDDLVRLLSRVNALQEYMDTAEGANLLAAYKRASNILKKEDWQGNETLEPHTGEEDPLALVDDPDMKAVVDAQLNDDARRAPLSYTPEPAEQVLIEALDAAEPTARKAVEAEDFSSAMAALASLRAPIDRFFEEVTVNADQENKRAARLDLLARFRAAVHNVADFSKIEG